MSDGHTISGVKITETTHVSEVESSSINANSQSNQSNQFNQKNQNSQNVQYADQSIFNSQSAGNSFYISRLIFKGFKSFKSAQARFPKGFVAIAGPNGSGKSNVADAIRFCFGEMGTKAIRAKRASELINNNSSKGEVTIVIENSKDKSQKFEIRRTICSDGKTSYELNGKKTTRTNVLESLRPYGLEIGQHNIIAQGQVQRIVEMHPKERREIVDQVAGISEFDEKKKEALNELSKVEQKISEARIVLSERGAYLTELEKEKDSALLYLDAKQNLERARATLVDMEYTKINSQFEETLNSKVSLQKEIDTLSTTLSNFAKKRQELDEKKKDIGQKMNSSGQKENLLEKIQNIKVQIAQSTSLLEEKTKRLSELDESLKSFQNKKKDFTNNLNISSIQLRQKEQYIEKLKTELEDAKKQAGLDDNANSIENSALDKINEQIISCKESKASTQASISANERLLASLNSKQQELRSELEKLKTAKGSSELDRYMQSIENINNSLQELFEKEKLINRQAPEIEKKLIESKELVATLRASVSSASRNPALLTVNALKESGESGIFGCVADLISTQPKFQQATEACAGSRLTYVVVDALDTANSIIKKLKSSKSGRCSFIPLDKINFSINTDRLPSGALGRMSEFIEYPAQIDKAIRYIFEETLLVSDVQSAKTIGVGKYRMVTLDGELLERSGVITGGSHKSSLLARASLDNAQSKSDDLKSQRDALYSELSYIRDEGQKLRKERASLELKVRTKEAEIGSIADRKLRIDRTNTEIEKITNEITTLNSDIETAKSDLQRFGGQEKALLARFEEQKNSINQKQQEQKEKMSNSQKEYQKALEKFSSFSTETQSLRQQVQLLTQQSTQLDCEILQCNQSMNKIKAEKSSIDSLLKSKSKELDNAQTQLKEVSATVEKFYAKMQLIEQELEAVEKEEGQSRYVFDSQNKKLNDLNIKHATISTRLVDLKSEWEKNKQVELLQQKDKSTLEKLISDSESKISELGMVNLKAPEIFEQKKQEQEQLSSRVETLHSEKSAVISLIDEIETKKRKLFNDTFNIINENFKRLFSMVYNGEASLSLDDEANPLDAGLGMRVRGQHDKKDKHLESMSGGEKTLLALMFIFSLQMKKPAPFYILDEAESALDKQNAHKMAEFIKIMSKTAQFLTITHHDAILSSADVVLGVSRGTDGSKIVGVQLSDTDDQVAESTNLST